MVLKKRTVERIYLFLVIQSDCEKKIYFAKKYFFVALIMF